MHSDVAVAAKQCLEASIAFFQDNAQLVEVPFTTWRRLQGGVWQSETITTQRPYIRRQSRDWQRLAEPLGHALLAHHSDHLGVLGSPILAYHHVDAGLYLSALTLVTWDHLARDIAREAAIGAAVDELTAFIDTPDLCANVVVPIVNLRFTPPDLDLPVLPGMRIREPNDSEATRIYGGPPTVPPSPARPHDLHPLIVSAELREPKDRGQLGRADSPAFNELMGGLDRLLLAFRTYKTDPIGYDGIFLALSALSPLFGETSRAFMREYVPIRRYSLSQDDIGPWSNHVQHYSGPLHPSLQAAAERLASANVRSRPSDRILDAIIGLESILLCDIGDPTYRGELRYRFAMNYALLHDSSEARHAAFSMAKQLYDLRSRIAHGSGTTLDRVKIGRDTISLSEAAQKATATLQKLILRFLPDGENPVYTRPGYWTTACFGEPDQPIDDGRDGGSATGG